MKIKRGLPMSKEEKTERRHWDFNSMRVDVDAIDIHDKADWPTATKRAHAFGCTKTPKWRFKTTWLKDKKCGRIRRVS